MYLLMWKILRLISACGMIVIILTGTFLVAEWIISSNPPLASVVGAPLILIGVVGLAILSDSRKHTPAVYRYRNEGIDSKRR